MNKKIKSISTGIYTQITKNKIYEVLDETLGENGTLYYVIKNDKNEIGTYSCEDFEDFEDTEKIDLKYDKGKNRLSLIEPNFILGVGQVLTYGAVKYKPNSWQTLQDAEERYRDALLRHTMAYLNGEKVDTESGISHLKHMATNIMFLQYFEEKENE